MNLLILSLSVIIIKSETRDYMSGSVSFLLLSGQGLTKLYRARGDTT